MKKFLLRLVCFLAVLILLPAGYFVYVQSLPAMYRGSLMGSVYLKQRLLRETEGARILIVGGSSVPYSIECETVAEAAGMPCIAVGAAAALGMEYYLALIDGELHEGDIVVLAPEFSMLRNVVSYSTTWMAVENTPSLLRELPLSSWPSMISSFYSYSREKLALYRSAGVPVQTPEEQLAEFGFGPWGDIVAERGTILASGYDRSNLLTLDESSLSPEVVRAVNRFCEKAERAGAKVVMTWAPFDALAYTGTTDELDELEARIRAEMKPEYVGRLSDCMMDGTYFYNSNNHLTSEGARLRTEMLVEDLTLAGVL